jgi:hypothetical protein
VNYFHVSYQPSVIIRIASPTNPSAKHEFPSTFVEMQGKRLIVDVQEPVAVSSAITVECDDAMFLGEVAAVTPANGRYHVEISVEQVLSGLQSLMALRAQLLGENTSAARSTATAGALQTV